MKLHLNTSTAQKYFTAHGDGYVAVNGERFGHPIIVTREQVLSDWQPPAFDALDEVFFDCFLALKPEILLIGTGAQQRFAPPRLYQALSSKGIGVEFMNTAAACRTYNILTEEGRKVVAAILI